MTFSDFDLKTMALTVWAEARGEPRIGWKAVAWVIRNRYEHPAWWSRNAGHGIPDDTIAAVCRCPWQFSCWNPSDPQSKRLADPETLERPDYQSMVIVCQETLEATKRADPTEGADHYCTVAASKMTRWAQGRKPVATIGSHVFYKIGPNWLGKND